MTIRIYFTEPVAAGAIKQEVTSRPRRYTSRSQQDNLWESWVALGEDFYAAITAAPVSVDMRALRALKRSPLSLDLYAWVVHTAFTASRKREARGVPWEGLHGQMGAEYAEIRRCKQSALVALKKIALV